MPFTLTTMGPDPGWYWHEGDPPGTVRAWDGSTWIGGPESVAHLPLRERARATIVGFTAGAALTISGATIYAINVSRTSPDDYRPLRASIVDTQATVSGLVAIATTVAFIFWYYGAYGNLRWLRGQTKWTQSWAIWGWIVPIINLFLPYRIMQELQPESPTDSAASKKWHRVLITWWGLSLVASIVSLTMWFAEPSRSFVYVFAALAADAANLVSSVLAILLVRRVTKHQDARLPAASS